MQEVVNGFLNATDDGRGGGGQGGPDASGLEVKGSRSRKERSCDVCSSWLCANGGKR